MSGRNPINHNIASDHLQPGDRITYSQHVLPGTVLFIEGKQLLVQLDNGRRIRTRIQAVHYNPSEATIAARALALRKKALPSVCIPFDLD
jgi:hypothetical protein